MTDSTELISSTGGDAAVIAELAEQAASREPVDVGNDIGFILNIGQRLERIDTEPWENTPRRKKGRATLTDADSFVTYVGRHQSGDTTTLWGDVDAGTITALFNDHAQGDDTAGWGDHRATLNLKHTPDWLHWLRLDGKLVTQAQFAEHIEDGVAAIVTPDAATMLEVAQTFHAKTGVNYQSTKRLSGEVEFAYEETTAARAGVKGKLEVPQTVVLSLAPFDGGSVYPLTARIRFRLSDGQLSIGYRLIRPDVVLRDAFDDIVATVAGGTGLPVLSGTPRG